MKVITNPKKIQRNYKIGMYTTLASLVFLLGAVGLTLPGMFNAEQVELATYSPIAMLVGLITSQVGMYYANRFGKSPRIDEKITQGLKGLDDRFTLYHYVTDAPHVLVGPNSIYVIAGMYQGGTITYTNGRYHQQGVKFFNRFVGQEGLSRPEAEVKAYTEDFTRFVKKNLPENELPPIEPLIVFTSDKATVQAQDAPVPTMHVEKLKDYVRRMMKEKPAVKSVKAVVDILPEEDVE